uniref:Uncharacterized protein n=1 Tax=Anguilla anguilla TaxID=7936 RepID=A0A0E9Q6H2_ANGAN
MIFCTFHKMSSFFDDPRLQLPVGNNHWELVEFSI